MRSKNSVWYNTVLETLHGDVTDTVIDLWVCILIHKSKPGINLCSIWTTGEQPGFWVKKITQRKMGEKEEFADLGTILLTWNRLKRERTPLDYRKKHKNLSDICRSQAVSPGLSSFGLLHGCLPVDIIMQKGFWQSFLLTSPLQSSGSLLSGSTNCQVWSIRAEQIGMPCPP